VTRVHLRPGHVQPLWAGHPWVYAQAIARVDGSPEPGDVVEVADPKGIFLGRGFWSPKSAIPVRILTRHPDETPDDAWLLKRIEEAKQRDLRIDPEGIHCSHNLYPIVRPAMADWLAQAM
jgi:23S rRNA (cytosine1962-C5)-methyltransferase